MHESNATGGERKVIPPQSVDRLAFIALLLGNIALAFGPLFVRMATDQGGIGPLASAFWRLALAAPALLLLTRVTRQPIGRMTPWLWATLALGGLFFAGDLASWHLGILKTKLANATLFGNSTSLIFPIYGFITARAWPTRSQGMALALAAGGAILLLGRSYELSAQNMVGDLLCLLAGLLYTFYLIAIDRARATLMPWPVLTLSTLFGIVPLLVFAAAFGESIVPTDWTAPVLLALCSQIVGQGLLVFAMGHVRPLIVGLALLSQPIVAATIGFVAYGETVTTPDLIGAAAIGLAIILVRRRGKPTELPLEDANL
ncbi:MAG: EamA family transporter [Sphingomonas sanxanigenens]|uniref:EamA family transporter n=1 Tax=Sphingomonas sanxanigenens TaxID=397260 RepID=A0A2W5C8Y5_9SPHN|nr:MAG: EamA family transporter [Sphingomonas sanxanigenens]